MNARRRIHRWAGSAFVLGLCLMAASAVAHAENPTPEATPVPTPAPAAPIVATATATATPEPTATIAPTITPAAATPTASAAPVETATPDPTPTATLTETAAAAPPRREPTSTPAPRQSSGASLTLCHADGNGSYTTVTIPADGFDTHFDHEDDVIPAPAGGCETIDPADPDASADDPVFVCHATGDPERPFTLSEHEPGDLDGHENHPGDLIPAPDGSCPGLDGYAIPTVTPTPTPTPDATVAPTATATPPDVDPPEQCHITVDKAGAAGCALPPEDDDRGHEGDHAGGGGSAPTATETGTTAPAPAQQLPFTGFELWLIAAAGLGLTLIGGGLRLLSNQPPAVGVTR